MVNEVITCSSADNSLFEKSLSCAETDVPVKRASPSPKTPDRAAIPEPIKKVSPIVEKKNRSHKRKFLGNPIPYISDSMKLNDDDFNVTKLSNDARSPTTIPETCDNITKCTPPLYSLASPEILTSMSQCNRSVEAANENLLKDTPKFSFRESRRSLDLNLADKSHSSSPEAKQKMPDMTHPSKESKRSEPMDQEIVKTIEPLPAKEISKFGFRKSRRSLDMSLVNEGQGRSSSSEAKRKTPETNRPSREAKRFEPMDLEIAKTIERLPEVPVESGSKEKLPKTVWTLKRSREQLTNSKLKQTFLATTPLEKKVDISMSSEYKGGSAVQLNVKKPDANGEFLSKENIEETFFDPLVTSTHNNDSDVFVPPNSAKAAALAESTNKPRTPKKIDNSFDCLPSTSPKYKYQRDAIRKKSERWKLPGQECAKCFDFYQAKRAECSDSQIRKLLNKCSRHRHKFPIQAYTPPGLWNPVFDDTDDEADVK